VNRARLRDLLLAPVGVALLLPFEGRPNWGCFSDLAGRPWLGLRSIAPAEGRASLETEAAPVARPARLHAVRRQRS